VAGKGPSLPGKERLRLKQKQITQPVAGLVLASRACFLAHVLTATWIRALGPDPLYHVISIVSSHPQEGELLSTA
jgi:hypothetical protein